MITKFVKEEGVEKVAIGNVVIMLLQYADVVFFCKYFRRFAKTYEGTEFFLYVH